MSTHWLEASHPGTSAERLARLSYERSDAVRKAVAGHHNASLTTLLYLAQTFPEEVARNPAFAEQVTQTPDALKNLSEEPAIAFATLDEVPGWLAEALAASTYPAVGVVLAARPMLTSEMRSKLRSMRGGEVYRFFLHEPKCPEDLFMRILRMGDDEKIPQAARVDKLLHRQVARMKHVPAVALDYLRTSPDDDVREALDRRGLAWTPLPLRFALRHATARDVGHVRAHNEDDVRAWVGATRAVFAVADGMGGGSSGDVAADAAVEMLVLWAQEEKGEAPQDRLHHAFVAAHYDLLTKQHARHIRGSGTTLVAALIEGDAAYIANNGDSRAYLVRNGAITLLTHDHSLLNEYLKVYPLTPQEIEEFPHKNILVRSLGYDPVHATPDISVHPLKPGDRLLLCTDGLYKMLSDAEMLGLLDQGLPVEATAKGLLGAVMQTKADDNIALVVVEVAER